MVAPLLQVKKWRLRGESLYSSCHIQESENILPTFPPFTHSSKGKASQKCPTGPNLGSGCSSGHDHPAFLLPHLEAFKSSLIPSSLATRLGQWWSCYRGLNSKSLKGELGQVYAVSSLPRAWHTCWLQEGFAQAGVLEGVSPRESQVLAVASEALRTATPSSLLLAHSAPCPQPLLCTHDGPLRHKSSPTTLGPFLTTTRPWSRPSPPTFPHLSLLCLPL